MGPRLGPLSSPSPGTVYLSGLWARKLASALSLPSPEGLGLALNKLPREPAQARRPQRPPLASAFGGLGGPQAAQISPDPNPCRCRPFHSGSL